MALRSGGTKFLQSIWKHMMDDCRGFDKCMKQVIITHGGEGKCVAEMTVEEEHTNRGGTLHGGFSASLVDMVSTLALMTNEHQAPGVSVNIGVSYLKAARIGDEIVIEAKTSRVGKTLAFLTVDIKNKKTGDLIVQGTHTKYIG